MPNWLTELLSGVGGAAIGAAASRGLTRAQSEGVAVETLRGVLEEMRAELDRRQEELNEQHDRHEEEIEAMRAKVDGLVSHLTVIADNPPPHLG